MVRWGGVIGQAVKYARLELGRYGVVPGLCAHHLLQNATLESTKWHIVCLGTKEFATKRVTELKFLSRK